MVCRKTKVITLANHKTQTVNRTNQNTADQKARENVRERATIGF